MSDTIRQATATSNNRSAQGYVSDSDDDDDDIYNGGAYLYDSDPYYLNSDSDDSDDSDLYDATRFYAQSYDTPQHRNSSSSTNRQSSAPATPATPKPAPPPPALCRFFVLGKCKFGSHCTYSHSLAATAASTSATADGCVLSDADMLVAAAAQVDCPYFLRGHCKYGEFCRLRHATLALEPTDARSQVATNNNDNNNQQDVDTNATAAAAPQRDHTCGICFDDVVECGKHFGLLSCDHCYCLDCLRAWRQSTDMEAEVTRSCPACRMPSNYIVPSLAFVTGAAKQHVVAAYKSHLAVRECKYFSGVLGSCPFGPFCFYAHRNAAGDDIKHLDRPRRRKHERSTSSRSHVSDGRSNGASLSSLLSNYGPLFRFLESLDWEDDSELDDADDVGFSSSSGGGWE